MIFKINNLYIIISIYKYLLINIKTINNFKNHIKLHKITYAVLINAVINIFKFAEALSY